MGCQLNNGAPFVGLMQPPVAATDSFDRSRLEQDLQQLIRERRWRTARFAGVLFADPAWDILLVLALAHCRQHRLSVTKLCERIDVPMTTALRWTRMLTIQGLLIRRVDVNDKRRKFIELSPCAFAAMAAHCTADLGRWCSTQEPRVTGMVEYQSDRRPQALQSGRETQCAELRELCSRHADHCRSQSSGTPNRASTPIHSCPSAHCVGSGRD